MLREKSAGILIFRRSGYDTLFLLLHYSEGHWDFAKGHMEEGENEHDTALREAREETGITELRFVDGFREQITYFYMKENERVLKEAAFFLAETESENVTISSEHTESAWLPYKQARLKLTFDNARQIIDNAMDAIRKSAQN